MSSSAPSGLSPDAHGTLQALQHLQEIRFFDEGIAGELVSHNYAERVADHLRLTERGRKIRSFAAARQRVVTGS